MAPSFLRRHLPMALIASLLVGGLAVGAIVWSASPGAKGAATAAKTYAATGRVAGFGPERSYASIAHDAIPGFMEPMTMAFEFAEPDVAQGIEEGDRVRFAFSADAQGRLVIVSMAKEP